jgi:hypothetical protein
VFSHVMSQQMASQLLQRMAARSVSLAARPIHTVEPLAKIRPAYARADWAKCTLPTCAIPTATVLRAALHGSMTDCHGN